ncbi:MAG: cytochrome c maturation protein CcmE [Janthinobacterium lividum]
MTPRQKQRFKFLAFAGTSVSLGLGLLLFCLQENMMYFYTPSDLKGEAIKVRNIFAQKKIRLGGLVKEGTVRQDATSLNVLFDIWDQQHSIHVSYRGVLPDLFREGQGVVVEGFFKNNQFQATLVLAKHDENYRPPDVSKDLLNKVNKSMISGTLKK